MKALITSIAIFLMPLASQASRVTCFDGHEKAAAELFTANLRQNVIRVFKKKGIALDPAKLNVIASASTLDDTDSDATTYATFSLDKGELVSGTGTDFSLDMTGPNDSGAGDQFLPTYLPVLSSQGFDKEGNPIHPHCTLQLTEPSFSNYANALAIQNAHSGKVIVKIALPAKIKLY